MKILKTILFWSTITILGFSFFSFSYVGFHTFMMADDYCWFAVLKRHDFLTSLINAYTKVAAFGGNRFSAMLIAGLSSHIGSKVIPIFPLLTFTGLLSAFTFSIKQILDYFRIAPRKVYVFTAALFFLFIFLYTSPAPFQNRYWFAGILTYTFPIILFSLLIGLIFLYINNGRRDWKLSLLVFLVSMLAMGFSETCAAAFFVFLIFMLFLLAFDRLRRRIGLFLVSCLGCITGLALLFFSPAAHLRLSSQPKSIFNPLEILLTSLDFSIDFLKLSIMGLFIPLIVSAIAFIAVGFLHFRSQKVKLSKKHLFIISIISIFWTFLVITASMSPTVFSFGSYLNVRSQIVPMFFLILEISALAFIFGAYLSQKNFPIIVFGYFPIILALTYVFRGSIISLDYAASLSQNQEIWKTRDLQIRESVSMGIDDVIVRRIDRIEQVMDFNPSCFMEYYQLDNLDYLN